MRQDSKKSSVRTSPGARIWQALSEESPLQVIGTINAYSALMAERIGYRALYLSGAGVANASYGLPDLGMTSCQDVIADVQRITAVTDLPLLVDVDTGWGGPLNIARTVHQMINAGAAGIHIEDQATTKRCGHRSGKRLVSLEQMVARIRAALAARSNNAKDPRFMIIARSDALETEGEEGVLTRLEAYHQAGADMLFVDAVPSLDLYQKICKKARIPVLANMTEFGRTPLLTVQALNEAGVSVVLYPLSAFRAMSLAAWNMYKTIREEGTQESRLPDMQTREALYEILDYHRYESEAYGSTQDDQGKDEDS